MPRAEDESIGVLWYGVNSLDSSGGDEKYRPLRKSKWTDDPLPVFGFVLLILVIAVVIILAAVWM